MPIIASPFYAFQQSDFFGQFIVFILIILSIIAWTIFAEKFVYLKTIHKQIKAFLNMYQANSQSLTNLKLNMTQYSGPLKSISEHVFNEINKFSDSPDGIPDSLNENDIDCNTAGSRPSGRRRASNRI